MIAAILAAGRGTRMQPFSSQYPKPLLPIGNKPLLQHQIEMARELGVREFLIVIGHLGHQIAQTLGDGKHLGVKIHYVEQTQALGIAHALGKLESYIREPVLLFLGDIFFVTDDLAAMQRTLVERKASAVLAVKVEKDPTAIQRNFTVLFNDDSSVRRVIEKPRHSTTEIKGCGLYLFDVNVFDAIRRTPRTAMRDEYEITDTIQIMVDDGSPVYCENVVKWDINLTYPEDVLRCNMFHLEAIGQKNLIGEGASIHPGAKLHNTVVGDWVTIEHPIEISNSVILSDTKVIAETAIDRFVITPAHQIDCRNTLER
jgi:NDP-sugar pyrophosphorylase family protein